MDGVKRDPLRVKMVIVADVRKTGEGAKVVPGTATDLKPRVDVKTEVETYDRRPGTQSLTQARKTTGNTGAAVAVGKGGGVLGHLLATKTPSVPEADKLSSAELRELLGPYEGRELVVTTWDREEASDLKGAAKKQSVGDTRGRLVGVNDEGVRLEKDGRVETVRREFWALARIRLDDEARTVLAQDPSYPTLFND